MTTEVHTPSLKPLGPDTLLEFRSRGGLERWSCADNMGLVQYPVIKYTNISPTKFIEKCKNMNEYQTHASSS